VIGIDLDGKSKQTDITHLICEQNNLQAYSLEGREIIQAD